MEECPGEIEEEGKCGRDSVKGRASVGKREKMLRGVTEGKVQINMKGVEWRCREQYKVKGCGGRCEVDVKKDAAWVQRYKERWAAASSSSTSPCSLSLPH